MSIDWSQVLEKPEKAFKVPGQLLLQQRNKIESLQKSIDELKAAKEESDSKASSLSLRIDTVLGDLEAGKKKVQEQSETIDKLKEVVAGLEDNLASSDEKQTQAATKIEELEGIVASKDAEIAEQTNKISELEAQIATLQEAQAKAQEFEQQLAAAGNLQAELEEKNNEINSLQGKLNKLEENLANTKSDKQSLEGDVEKKIAILEEEKNSFEEQYKLKEAEVEEMKSLLPEGKTLQELLADKDATIGALQEKISHLEVYAPAARAGDEEGDKKSSGIQSQIPWKSGTGMFVCPDCGSNRSEDVQDKSRVLYVAAGTPIYAKKKRCLNCGAEWSID